jgi:hypothetical protein
MLGNHCIELSDVTYYGGTGGHTNREKQPFGFDRPAIMCTWQSFQRQKLVGLAKQAKRDWIHIGDNISCLAASNLNHRHNLPTSLRRQISSGVSVASAFL